MTDEKAALDFKFIEKMPIALCIIEVCQNEEGKTVDFKLRYYNEACKQFEGFESVETTSRPFYEAFPASDKKWLSIYEKTAFLGETQNIETYCPEIDKHLKLTIWQIEKGLCGCRIEDVSAGYLLRKATQTHEAVRDYILQDIADIVFFFDEDAKHIYNRWHKKFPDKVYENLPFPESLVELGYMTQEMADLLVATLQKLKNEDVTSCDIETTLPEDGCAQWYKLRFLGDFENENGTRQIIGYMKNETEAIKNRQILEERADIDMLTGVWNRSKGMALLQERCNAGISKEKTGAYFSVDIDGMKDLNAQYGAIFGDEVIAFTAKTLKETFRKDDTIVRMTGDSFAVFAENITSEEVVAKICRRFHARLQTHPAKRLSCSIGVYLTDKKDDVMQFYQKTNVLMNRARELGPSGYYICTDFEDASNTNVMYGKAEEDFSHVEQSREALLVSVAEAMENKELKAFYQPQYDAVTNKLVGAEALVRWQKSDGTFVLPGSFIPSLEKDDAIMAFDWFILEEAAAFLQKQKQNKVPRVCVSVNFSRRHISEKAFVEKLCRIVDRYEVPHSLIEVEITESAFVDDANTISEWIDAIRAEGFRVAIDDFGSGLSSLSFVKNMDVDVIKIDKSLLDQNCEDEKERIVLESVFSFANRLHLTTIAEGVETREQLSFLRSCSCKVIQGYLFAKPMPEDAFMALCQRSEIVEATEDILNIQPAASATQLLVDALFIRYQMIIYINLTRNSYYMMTYDDFTTRVAPSTGGFDELVAVATPSIHPEDREKFAAAFSRDHLLKAHEEGEKSVGIMVKQLGDDGIYRWVEITDYFVKNPSVDDVLVISTTRIISEVGKEPAFNKKMLQEQP